MQRKRTHDNQVAHILDVMSVNGEFTPSPQKKAKSVRPVRLQGVLARFKKSLHQAVVMDERDQVRAQLLNAAPGAVDEKDYQGLTALHVAVMCRLYKMAHVLINRHARFDLPDDNGVTAYDLAVEGRDDSDDDVYAEIISLMDAKTKAARPTTSKILYRTPEYTERDPNEIYYINTVAGQRIVGPGFFAMKFGNNNIGGHAFKHTLAQLSKK